MFPDSTRPLKWIITVFVIKKETLTDKIGLEKQNEPKTKKY